jgi:Flp pilus assembly pilin Flp
MLEKEIESACRPSACIGVLARTVADRRAVTAVEYAIIVGVMVAALVVGMPAIGKNLTNIFSSVATPL